MAEDGLEPAKRLCLDAFERDCKTFAPSFVLEVHSHVEDVDAANHDPKAVAALDDVRVDEPASGHLSAERQGLLVCLAPPEDRLQPADELESSSAGLLGRLDGRRARKAERRHRAGKAAGKASQHEETSDPHGAQS